ncbi:class I SAM-dependent methyltransferase [Candidatus Pacearchaeota archaeon]|jgi:SAM-dependent methyltransferase|nr:class I SAM-dependent methyltransferase [Candidatus Pacearchaeota archaeon]
MTTIQKFFDGDDFLPLRRESYNFIAAFLKTCRTDTKLLEVGPSGILDKNTPYPEWDTSSYIQWYCEQNKIMYKSCDILEGCSYKCSITKLSEIGIEFDYIIANSVLEHVPTIWRVPREINLSLKDGGKVLFITPFMFKLHGPDPDCWRISPAGYQALFGDYFNINIESYPTNQCEKNGIPLLIKFEGIK